MKKRMFNTHPLFSIVIANYNGGQYLEKAILSILSQSCQDFELIIADGGSRDNSVEVIKKYEKKIAWWVSEKDSGQSHAFNKAFNQAQGEFYFWINADDLLLPKSLQHLKKHIEKYPKYKWFVANTIFINDKDTILNCSRGPIWKDFAIKNGPIYVFGPTSIFHKNLFHDAGGFDEKLHYTMDTDLWMKFNNNKNKFKRISKYFWTFRIHEGSKTSHSFSGPATEEYEKERRLISEKNSHFYTSTGHFIQSFLKIIDGSFLKSKFDTRRFKGKSIFQYIER